MRIAYIAPYQGQTLVQNRPSSRNLSLAARVKMGLIAELLHRNSHTVEILSQGEVIEPQLKYYPPFEEPEAANENIPVYYASAFPVRFVNGLWSSRSTLRLFKERHRVAPYDLVMIYNLKPPQVTCATYARERLRLPIILDYEDDAFSDVWGNGGKSLTSKYYLAAAKRLLNKVSACVGVSPYLLEQAPRSIPKLLLRGIVADTIVKLNQERLTARKNWVVFSGTHEGSQGIEQLLAAWNMLKLADWELHIAGQGPLTPTLHKLAGSNSSIVFHGLLSRDENARMLCSAKIGMNPQDLTQRPGNVFAFKIIEYLAAALHVITTPRGALESDLEAGISYISDNKPETIASCLKKVIDCRHYERTAEQAALLAYGPVSVAKSLNGLIDQVALSRN